MAEVRLDFALAHPPARVWRALTEAPLLGEWFMPTDLAVAAGGRFTLHPGTLAGFPGPVSGELAEVVAPRRMVMLWQGDKLHTRVTWELTETADGCTLRVRQTGFIGVPATLRRRTLRDTYRRLFGERLPEVLDRIAHGGLGAEGGAAAVPRQRRPANIALGAWSAGRTVTAPPGQVAVPAAGGPAAPRAGSPGSDPDAGGAAGDPGAPAPVAGGPLADDPGGGGPGTGDPWGGSVAGGPAAGDPAGGGGDLEPGTVGAAAAGVRQRKQRRPAPGWRHRLTAPTWLRAVTVGAVAALTALVLLAVLTSSPDSPQAGAGDRPGHGDGERGGPGMAVQPGEEAAHTGSPASPGAEAPAGAPGPPASAAPPAGSPSGDPRDTGDLSHSAAPVPSRSGPPESTPAPGQPPPAPVLTAQWSSSAYGLPLLGGRRVAVTVSNPGPGSADPWEVTMDVGDQGVTNVSGAAYQRDGTRAIFTADAPLGAGDRTEFTYDIPSSGLLGLGGTEAPTDCTIDGRPCDG